MMICDKHATYTKRDAVTLANYCRTRKGLPISAFQCPCCGGWHIGKVKTEQQQRLFRTGRTEPYKRERFVNS